jgi:hypothetical protein
MDLIVGLPQCPGTGHDAVVVFVDRCSKMVHVALTHTKATAEQLADVFMNTVFRQHGMPQSIESGCDVRFTYSIWQARDSICPQPTTRNQMVRLSGSTVF